MRVFVTGATGAVGRPTVARLVDAGHEVTALARGPAKRAEVEAAGATASEVDLFDPAAVREAVDGHDAVVNLATHLPTIGASGRASGWAENDRLRRSASAHLVDAALATGAGRFVQESIVFLYPDSGDRWIDAATVEPAPTANAASALVAEAHAARVTAAGGAGVALRFGMFYGPGVYHTEAFLRMARRGLAYGAGAPGGYMSMIHVDDAAAAVVAALAVPAGVYDVVDDEPVTSADFAAALAAAVGRPHHVRVPGRLMRLGGRQAASLLRSQRVSNRRFREASGWAPRHPDVRAGLAAVVG